jgi:hypothetical protein
MEGSLTKVTNWKSEEPLPSVKMFSLKRRKIQDGWDVKLYIE